MVKFEGEDTLTCGSVSFKWPFLLLHEMFNQSSGLFEYWRTTVPVSGVNVEHPNYFKFIRRVIGISDSRKWSSVYRSSTISNGTTSMVQAGLHIDDPMKELGDPPVFRSSLQMSVHIRLTRSSCLSLAVFYALFMFKAPVPNRESKIHNLRSLVNDHIYIIGIKSRAIELPSIGSSRHHSAFSTAPPGPI